jgi:hypothetical protein
MASPIEHLHDRLTTKCPLSGGTLEDGRSSTRRWSKFDSKMVEVRLNVRFPGGHSKMVEVRLEDGRTSTRRLTLMDHMS